MNKINELARVAKLDEEILALILFGSITRQENLNYSDVDICLILKHQDYSSKYLSYKKLKYLKEFNLDIQIFQQLPIYIKKRIIGEGKILFCKDEDEVYKIAFKTIEEFADFEHIYRDYLKEVASVR
jgi:predicted nucleotidyltransferase